MRVLLHEDVNFLLTNRIPRRLATRVVGRVARAEHPLVRAPALALWRWFGGVDLSDAATTRFRSLRDGFTRALRPGARPFDADPAVIASPCDAAMAARFGDGWFVTLRLTAAMYHRFHAPHDLTVESVTYISGDCWNVNPIALKRVERLFCRNERAVIEARLAGSGLPVLLVPVAAVLVASIRLTFIDTGPLARAIGPTRHALSANLAKGAEMGWFEHGSTILMLLPASARPDPALIEGHVIRAGEALARIAGR